MSSPLFWGQLVGVSLEMKPPAAERDTTYTKLFVGGLPYHTDDESLRRHFQSFGDIDEAVVITDRHTGKSRGYGFVSPPFIKADSVCVHFCLLAKYFMKLWTEFN